MAVIFDPKKDELNIRDHGISLARAEALDLSTALITFDDDEGHGEDRWLAIGFIEDRLHVLCFTMRGEDVRAISLRKATKQETRDYATKA